MANRSNQKIEPGDEVTLRAIVTSVLDNGQFTVQFRSSGQRVTVFDKFRHRGSNQAGTGGSRKGEKVV